METSLLWQFRMSRQNYRIFDQIGLLICTFTNFYLPVEPPSMPFLWNGMTTGLGGFLAIGMLFNEATSLMIGRKNFKRLRGRQPKPPYNVHVKSVEKER